MLKDVVRRLLGLSGLLLCGAVHAEITPCRLPDFPQELRCGKVERPLNPDDVTGKKIDIQYVILPSQDKNKLQDAIFLLAGGPGQSAINVASFGQAILSRLNKRRDIVFVDQRGTGRSASLACPEVENAADVENEDQMLKKTEACLARLKKLPYGDLRFFSTSIAVQDLEAVRKQQGYDKINLVGASYGTRVGLEYMRQFPQSVKRVVLDGVVPPEMSLPSGDAQAALDGVFADCAKQTACNASYPNLAHRWQHLLASMPKQISVIHPRLGTPLNFEMRRELLLSLVHKTLYTSTTTSALPYAITQAEHGNYQALVTLSGATNLPGPGSINYGMHFSVWCSEAFSHQLPPAKDEFEQMMNHMYERTCKNWPRATIPPEFFTIPPAQSPVLLLSGGIDPVTPIRHGAAVATALGANAIHVTLNNAGHGLMAQGCVRDVVYRFLNTKQNSDALKIDSSCVRPIPRPLAWQPLQESKEQQP
ncbi:alpha/beta hydrolase [Undibacterium jejuense]|uniref:Alpha/beta hydrolase n=1 Tax=Undibacterium jejuense TaxID=1344949 RepID=A0A923HGH9_9BURK|nr:alpha/beta hydrolase [Undibacterium jejuense]MBC3861197.1 alpha/beta hydrolase [Undibacterium jejuense]